MESFARCSWQPWMLVLASLHAEPGASRYVTPASLNAAGTRVSVADLEAIRHQRQRQHPDLELAGADVRLRADILLRASAEPTSVAPRPAPETFVSTTSELGRRSAARSRETTCSEYSHLRVPTLGLEVFHLVLAPKLSESSLPRSVPRSSWRTQTASATSRASRVFLAPYVPSLWLAGSADCLRALRRARGP